ncbi:Cytoplasmic protein [Mycena chlorophos]|uniref:Cytoplasmic protein n=1 Tax=Mycena chlorophos TaxID=658473 RepID=A0A8H6VUV5_MYCCL|nr:Cytoplasmic protein [Mycena chlorophos]
MSSDGSDYDEGRKKSRKVSSTALIPTPASAKNDKPFSMQPLLETLDDVVEYDDFPLEELIDYVMPELVNERAALLAKQSQTDAHGQALRPLTRSEVASMLAAAEAGPGGSGEWVVSQAIAIRKLKVTKDRRRVGYPESSSTNKFRVAASSSTEAMEMPASALTSEHTQTVINALGAIRATPYENSFLARLGGVPTGVDPPGLVSVDWETVTPWMELMSDVREHFSLSHPEREPPFYALSPILYTALHPWHLNQVHDLLERAFWTGIDVRDSLDYSPERCTIIATYGKLVVGVAIMSSPRETYITYLTVRAGWDNARIATTMLYHLIALNPHQDITLHVSANNSAMLLYNRFGFKAEGFVAGFYETYLDPLSRASKNAFRLRLRQH